MASRFFHHHPGAREHLGPERLGVLGPRRIVVPVQGAPVDLEALRAACRLARPAKSAVLLIYVLEVPRNLPLAINLERELGAAEELLERMELLAAELGTRVETTILQAREAGPAVVDEAKRWDADLMVVGLGVQARFGEFTLDRTGSELLSHTPCRLILIREALDARSSDRTKVLSGTPD